MTATLCLDDILETKRQLEAIRPKNQIDIILLTGHPDLQGIMIQAEYEGKKYLMAGKLDFARVEFVVRQTGSPDGSLPVPAFFGIPIIEDDELFVRICLEKMRARVE